MLLFTMCHHNTLMLLSVSALSPDWNMMTDELAPPVVDIYFVLLDSEMKSITLLLICRTIYLLDCGASPLLLQTACSICCGQMPLSSQAPSHQYVRSIVLGWYWMCQRKELRGGGLVVCVVGGNSIQVSSSRADPFQDCREKQNKKQGRDQLGRTE